MDAIQVRRDGDVAIVTFANAENMNSFDPELLRHLHVTFRDLIEDPDIRALVLTGTGRAFSAGADVGEFKAHLEAGDVTEWILAATEHLHPLMVALHQCDKPFIAAVNGVAAGAGCSLALACDLRIASEHASFVEAFVHVGLIPDSGSTWFLPRLVGAARAFELCCTGRKVGAEEALAIGLVNQVVPAGELEAAAQKMAAQLAALPPRAIALTKRLLGASFERSLDEQLDAEAYDQETAGLTADHMEGVMAFLEKRKPEFTGA